MKAIDLESTPVNPYIPLNAMQEFKNLYPDDYIRLFVQDLQVYNAILLRFDKAFYKLW